MPRLEQRSCSLVRVSRTSGCVTTEFQPLRRCNRLACCEFQEVAFRFFVRRYHKTAEQEPVAAELKSHCRAESYDSPRDLDSALGGQSVLHLCLKCSRRRSLLRDISLCNPHIRSIRQWRHGMERPPKYVQIPEIRVHPSSRIRVTALQLPQAD